MKIWNHHLQSKWNRFNLVRAPHGCKRNQGNKNEMGVIQEVFQGKIPIS